MRNAMDPNMTRKGKNQSSSIGCELGNLVNGRPHTWTVTPATDIDAVADCIVEFFVSHGLPYLEKYSSPDAMFNLIAPNPERPCLDSPFLDKRAINVVGLALLLNRSQDIPCLVNQYEARLEAAYPFGLQGFRDFVAANV